MPANKNGPGKKKKGRRARLLVITFVLLLVAGVAFGAYWSVSTVRASFPTTDGTLKLKGLSGEVKVVRDDHGIPQIYADNAEDLFRAQGFVQAQDRFWEMDVRRHLTAGRLSEMFGSGQVETDAFLRTMGWRRVAQQEYDTKLSPATKKHLQAYSDGVNAYLKDHKGKSLSVEYAALEFENDYKPEAWTPVDSVAWLKAMAWDLRGNMQEEIDRSLASSRLSPKQIEQLYPAYPYDRNKPITEGGTVDTATKTYDPKGAAGTGTQAGAGQNATTGGGAAAGGLRSSLSSLSSTLEKVPALLGPNGNGIGSNSWVVSGKYTTTGKPLLANDPHLAPQMPSLWYQVGLHCTKTGAQCPYDVAGYSFSGMPGVIIGHNKDIAWGMTNLGADVSDLYLEKVTADSYLYDGKQKPFVTRKETIKVAGEKSREITVRETNNGPIVSDRNDELVKVGAKAPVKDPAPDRADGYAVALRWTALDAGKTMDGLFALNKANDFQSFRKAAADFDVPSQNLIYADTKGNIGYQAPGRIPVRGKAGEAKGEAKGEDQATGQTGQTGANGTTARTDTNGDGRIDAKDEAKTDGKTDAQAAAPDGRLPAPGWDPAYQWTGWIPQSALPYDYNPERGYIVTANQAVADKKYPYLLTQDWGYGARSQRINELIQSKIKDGGKISTDDMQKMQLDNSSEIAKLLTPYLLKIDVKGANERETKYVREAQKLLKDWDYNQEADSAAAAYFNAVWRNTLKLAFGNKLPKELRVKDQCLRVRPADDSRPQEDLDGNTRLVLECGEREPDNAQPDGGDRWFEVVRSILDKPEDSWWKTSGTRTNPGAKNRDELLERAMKDARWELTSKLGKDVTSWSWGRLHQLNLKNQTLGKEGPGIVKWMLNRGPWNLAGGEAAVNAAGWNAAGGYDVIWVPSMRMVVNLDDLDKSRWINLTGASGHAYNAHYYDQTDKWAKGELLPWAFSPDAVKKSGDATLTLKP
ncbi:penicillin acylase family protein [Streptomyces triculaminicus]|uniref:Penicillin acylase family protein n=2 Tax=Streptomyces TaxID=1883 RepID=A0A939FH66_9ACTN|nr:MULTISPECIES: penicillin acylase family protein [Streptomyces]MBO0651845.1 penicillin acylase family protein [Streptomyces triculaminicus]QSY47230.1 penicillin acylase family protein [Streptomyces griseocarneus]